MKERKTEASVCFLFTIQKISWQLKPPLCSRQKSQIQNDSPIPSFLIENSYKASRDGSVQIAKSDIGTATQLLESSGLPVISEFNARYFNICWVLFYAQHSSGKAFVFVLLLSLRNTVLFPMVFRTFLCIAVEPFCPKSHTSRLQSALFYYLQFVIFVFEFPFLYSVNH